MTLLRRTRTALPFASTVLGLSLLAAPTTSLMAEPVIGGDKPHPVYEQSLFTWSGTVDREVFIVMRGRSVTTEGRDAGLPNRVRFGGEVPRGLGILRVSVDEGRGDVDVIEQPNPRNGYQAVIRIRDPRGGADRYRVTAIWSGDSRDRDVRDRDSDDRYRNGSDRAFPGKGHAYGRRGRDGDDRGMNRGGDDDRGVNRGGYDDRDDDGRSRYTDHGSLQWNGRVDDVVEIRIQGRRVDYVTRSGAELRDARSEMAGAGLPRQAVNVVLDRADGRGEVAVVQQPNARNDFTAVIRVTDPRGGAAAYGLVARW